MKSTSAGGYLRELKDCYIDIPNFGKINLNNLPDISDSKQSTYNEDMISGRSSPLHTWFAAGSRRISITFHFFITQDGDAKKNIDAKRAIESCLYPRKPKTGGGIAGGVAAIANSISGNDVPFLPPPICKFKCGTFLSDDELCLSLTDCNESMPTDVPWDEATYCPYKFDLVTNWLVVYASNDLPDQSRIIRSGR